MFNNLNKQQVIIQLKTTINDLNKQSLGLYYCYVDIFIGVTNKISNKYTVKM